MTTPLWTPNHPEATNMWHFMDFVAQQYEIKHLSCGQANLFQHADHGDTVSLWKALHQWSIDNPALFWQALCDFFKVSFDTPATNILNHYTDMLDARWFSGAQFNYAKQLLSRNDEHPAIVSLDERGQREVLTYAALRTRVSECAAALKESGIKPGDRVAGVMPNVAFTIIAMLASASIGAIWSSCSPDFGSAAIIDRLGQIKPSVLFICDGHSYGGKLHDAQTKINDISKMIPSLKQLVIYPHIHSEIAIQNIPKAIALNDFLKPAETLAFTSLPFAHPLYILFSSGTTGKPKCIIHGAGGTLLQHIKELGLHTDIKSEDNLLFYTTCGWMMWNWMVSTLALGATLTLYEGSPTHPNPTHLFQIIHDENITVFGTSAKFISCIEKEQLTPAQDFSMPSLRTILSTGSPLLPHNYDYVYQHIKANVQLSSISGGTDIVSCFALGNPILPVYPGELQCIGLGMSVEIYDSSGHSTKNNAGELVCTKPFPSMPIGFWEDENQTRYKNAYFTQFPNVWTHGDFAKITMHDGLIIYGRSDATLNPGGVRIGTAEIYRQLENIPEIVDSVVIGQNYRDDTRIVLFVKLMPNNVLDDELKTTICKTIRTNTSPRHVPSLILQVTDIPRTINGKLVEIAVRQTVQGETVKNLDSLANPESLTYFKNRPELSDC
ncbi:MAG: acetoacetate--CoA ligase [Legionellaceae bacterium]|nr:acetoacetate--CoA ligase [Legionellaceae bacterium]